MEPRAAFDPEYLQRLRDGDAATWVDFVTYFNRLIFFKLHRRVRSLEALEEIKQETLTRTVVAIQENRVEDPVRLGGYVARVAENVYFEIRRKQAPIDGGPVPEVVDDKPSLDRALIDSERRKKVRTLIEQLGERDRKVLRMLFYDEIEPDEVCRRLDVRPEHLKLLVHRARKRFQAKFRPGELEKW